MNYFSKTWNKINKDIIAGLTTFFTMSYIVIVIPLIWSTPGTGVSISFALTATVLVLFLINFIAGLYIKLPYAFGPGIGLNAFIVYTVILSQKIPFPIALGVIFWSSVLFILISVLPIRKKIIEALPENMKQAMGCGIGLFLAFIGFKNLNLIVANPTTLLEVGTLDIKILLGFTGFCIAFYLFIKNKPYAFLVSILSVTLLSIFTGQSTLPSTFFSKPELHDILTQIDIWGALKLSLIPTILAILMTNLFDSISTIIALSHSSQLHDNKGQPLRLKRILLVDSFGSFVSSLIGTSPTVVCIESATGIQAGGRSGIVPIVVALCFLPCLFLEPIVRIIPSFATAPILVFVGILMTLHLKNIRLKNFDDIIPVFLTIIMMPLTSSVTYGVIFGIVSYVIIKVLAGKFKEISGMLWIIAIISFFVFLSSFKNTDFNTNLQKTISNAQKNSSVSADFTQEYYSELREKTTISNGKIFLKQNLFRWEVNEPRKQVYVNDGKFVWKYEPEFNHVERFDIKASDLNFIKLLNHFDDVKRFYNIREWEEAQKKDGILNLVLEPREKNEDQRTLHVSIQIKTGYITVLKMIDPNGNKTNLVFNRFSNTAISNEKFVFAPPKGVVINIFKN